MSIFTPEERDAIGRAFDRTFPAGPQKFRKMPVEIEAMKWDGSAADATPIIDWALSNGGTARYHCTHDMGCPGTPEGHTLAIDTLEGTMQARAGDWIIRGVQGEFYPCKPDVFEQTYEKVPGFASGGVVPAGVGPFGGLSLGGGPAVSINERVVPAADVQNAAAMAAISRMRRE